MSHASRFSSARRQQGNTLVGIIIGLVIGLGIAVVVALVITKGASPFTDKSGKAGKSAEPTAGQIADPNKPMYGNKEAAKEAARDFSKEPREITSPTQPAAPAPATAQQPKAPPPDALQELIGTLKDKPAPKTPAAAAAPAPQAKADVKEAKADAAGDKWIYYLQAGAFHDMSDAESTRGKLALLGFEAAISDRSTDAGVLHRVRVGPFNQLEAMNRARTKLSENGIDVAVVRNQK